MNISTVLVPTYDRPKELARLLGYMKGDWLRPERVRIVVADGSTSEQLAEENAAICRQYGAVYRRYPAELLFFARIADAIRATVETESVVVFGDDDILCEQGFADAVDFLAANPEYAVAHGRYIGFSGPGSMEECYAAPSHDQDDPLERFFRLMGHYRAPAVFGVWRTTVSVRTFEALASLSPPGLPGTYGWYTVQGTHDAIASETLIAAGTTLFGKEKRLDSLYCARKFVSWGAKYVHYTSYVRDEPLAERFALLKQGVLGLAPSSVDNAALGQVFDSALGCMIGRTLGDEANSMKKALLGLAGRAAAERDAQVAAP